MKSQITIKKIQDFLIIIQNCEVIGFDVSGGKINGVRTSRGDIKAKKIGLCVAGSTNILAEKLNMTLPIETHLLQACVSEPNIWCFYADMPPAITFVVIFFLIPITS